MRTKNASVSSSKNGNDEYHAEETMTEHSGSPKAAQGTIEFMVREANVEGEKASEMWEERVCTPVDSEGGDIDVFVLVLIGHAKKDAPVPKWILVTVANSDDSMSFSWGTWAFLESLCIQSFGKDLVSEKKKLVKGGKTSNTLCYTGFVLPSSFLLFECINDFGETFGVKREQTNPALPRMCLRKNKISKKPSHEAIINALNAAKSVRSILLREGSEIRAPWITSLTSLPYVSNSTLGEFIRGIEGGDKHVRLCMKKQLLAPASEDEVAAGRNSSSDEVHYSSEGSEVPSKKYVFRRRKISRPNTPLGKAEHIPLLEKQSRLLERTTNIKASSFSGNSSQNLPDSLKDYIDGKFSELQKTLCQEVENVLERKFQTLEKRILLTLLDTLKGRSDEAKEKDGKEEESVEVNMVDPSSFEGVDHNEEEEIKDGKEEDEPMAFNMVNPSSFEGIPEEKRKKREEEEEKFAVEGEALEDEMTMSDKIVHDVVEFCKSTKNNVDENLESDGDVLRELTDVDEVAAARELGRGLGEKKRSIHISSPYFANVHKKVKVINNEGSNELDKAEEAQLNIRRNPSSQQLEAFHHFMQSAIADGREVQCIMEKRGESHGIVKKWWSSLIKVGGWLETSCPSHSNLHHDFLLLHLGDETKRRRIARWKEFVDQAA
ncbi:unnamed protein product [Cuscuta campestris]|uniref:Uncharacterized protein n=1 Tax=Cuscuta campestris TaxID=132261 RepID=A0A484NPS6_9ASTE|nr:unnamed protein product [Cuscuta campestris]